jgi:hypothetical protein
MKTRPGFVLFLLFLLWLAVLAGAPLVGSQPVSLLDALRG